MKDKRIDIKKSWFEPKLVLDIEVFFRIHHFYQCFIYGLSNIVGLLTSILERTSSAESAKNLLSNMANNAEIDENSDQNGMIKRSSHMSNTKKRMDSLNSNIRKAFK